MTPTQRSYYIQLLAEAWDSDRPGYLPAEFLVWQLAGRALRKSLFRMGTGRS
jgi:hypothetical protein